MVVLWGTHPSCESPQRMRVDGCFAEPRHIVPVYSYREIIATYYHIPLVCQVCFQHARARHRALAPQQYPTNVGSTVALLAGDPLGAKASEKTPQRLPHVRDLGP